MSLNYYKCMKTLNHRPFLHIGCYIHIHVHICIHVCGYILKSLVPYIILFYSVGNTNEQMYLNAYLTLMLFTTLLNPSQFTHPFKNYNYFPTNFNNSSNFIVWGKNQNSTKLQSSKKTQLTRARW